MKIDTKITINFSEEDIAKILLKHLEQEGYQMEGSISINLQNVTTGFGMGERDSTEFVGISVNVTKK